MRVLREQRRAAPPALRVYLPSTQRLRAGLTYAAPPALQKEGRLEALRSSGQADNTQEGRQGCITCAKRICPLLKEVASDEWRD